MNVFDELTWRGLVHQTSGADTLREHLAAPGRVMYCGFDPTAESLHIGNMVPLLALMRFALAGHRPMALLGGATGLIGDPSGKDKERQLSDPADTAARAERIKAQILKLFTDNGASIDVVNNLDWIGKLSAIELLRDVGKHFTVNYMLAKDSVKGRIDREESGISYTEFSYMILQAFDFHHLNREQGCTLQIGGGDQFGNITAGLELIRRKSGAEAHAMTFPLITTASGAKFGKSEKGAIYLDPNITTPYAFYQYWVNADDRDVVNYLKYFTFLPREEIEALAVAVAEKAHMREAQRTLAYVMTSMVHGRDQAEHVVKASEYLFGKGALDGVDPATLRAALEGAPGRDYASRADIPDMVTLLVELGLCSSKGNARKDLAAGAVTVNNAKVGADYAYPESDFAGGSLLLVRKGKKSYGVARLG
ncbi:Tyrosine--tRNA ligase [Fundidesulfovibrio magnetotacticus]|uniref:Tyrosine--tRNA ligase n=1 Tax=Fundidesulfovibrio magnetotacticus TaxID=2730080 RepID=A0A6V8LRW2_9BACT|nr:tyrosine--tRNA ligase [Fundidesulfovibrio magnetotacticus]GFK95212.1 Tyrosine--tRNA ligase [Fundidesulfovibrio magnetotacticus]